MKDANNNVKAKNKFYRNLVNAADAMQNSADDANKEKEQISLLAKNLGTLNKVYGNRLSAMQGR